jgi:hypothetical protein
MERQLCYPHFRADIWSGSAALVIGLTAIAMQVGTGGAQTAAYYVQRGLKGYAFVAYNAPSETKDAPKIRTPAEDLAHIRAVLRPAVTDLSTAMGVSRQAVYDWQNGKPIAAENASRLADLARSADVFAAAGVTTTAQLLRRPFVSGKTLLDIARDGGSLEAAAARLVQVVQRETEQRRMLAARLKGRPKPALSAEDYGTPILDELG